MRIFARLPGLAIVSGFGGLASQTGMVVREVWAQVCISLPCAMLCLNVVVIAGCRDYELDFLVNVRHQAGTQAGAGSVSSLATLRGLGRTELCTDQSRSEPALLRPPQYVCSRCLVSCFVGRAAPSQSP